MRTVIIVDDDLSIRRALRMQLCLAGFSVRAFKDGQSLLAAKLPADNACLLLDIYMPETGGLELLETMAAAGRQMPTILMSGRDDEETRTLVAKVNGNPPCLFKPFEQSVLLRAIEKVMPQRAKPLRQASRMDGGGGRRR